MRRNLLLLASVVLWLVGSAVAFAAVIDGDDRDNNLRSTPRADAMRGIGGQGYLAHRR